LISVYFDF